MGDVRATPKLWLAANQKQVVGLLLQKMPDMNRREQAAGEEWNYWEHLNLLANTITDAELLTLAPITILHRLFHEEDIRLFKKKEINFGCTCTKDKMLQVLVTMGKDEVDDILKNHHVVDVTCDFCNNHYAFTAQEAATVFL